MKDNRLDVISLFQSTYFEGVIVPIFRQGQLVSLIIGCWSVLIYSFK